MISRRNVFYFVMLALLCTSLFSACNSASKDAHSEESAVAGLITEEQGSTADYVGLWELIDHEGVNPFVYVAISSDDSDIVNCYNADGDFIDTGFIDYSEQRALNGKDLMVFIFQDIGEYGAQPHYSADKKYISLQDDSGFNGTLSACSEEIELVISPNNPVVKLSAGNADLDNAPDIVLEPDTPPYNLGGWKYENKVSWEFDIAQEGEYVIWLDYSRPYSPYAVQGTVNIYHEEEAEPNGFLFRVDSTSYDSGEWSSYLFSDLGSIYFESGAYRLEIVPGIAEDLPPSSHFVNLRSVLLTLESSEGKKSNGLGDTESGSSYTLADFKGWWYQDPDATYNYQEINMGMFHLDSEEVLWIRMDKYGNDGYEITAEYNAEEDALYTKAFGVEVFLSFEGDDMNTLYDQNGDPAFIRGEAPPVYLISLREGKWFKDGIREGDDYHIEVFEDSTYSFISSSGTEIHNDILELTLKESVFHRELRGEYIDIKMDSGGSGLPIYGQASLDLMAIVVSTHETQGGMDYTTDRAVYIHEDTISKTEEAHDTIQRAKLFSYSCVSEGNGTIDFDADGKCYSQGSQTKFGTWEYEKGVLTIIWNGELDKSEIIYWDSSVEEICTVENVEDGFTIPSIGLVAFHSIKRME